MDDERERGRPDARGEGRPRRDSEPAEEAPVKGKKKKFKKEKPKKVKKIKKEKKLKVKKEKKEKGEGGKKGKKLPVMIALAVILLGGGFFGFKMVSGEGDEGPPPVTLGDDTHIFNLGEALVNTKDGGWFLQANVMLHLADGTHLFGEGGGHDSGPSIETLSPYIDAVRSVLAQQTLETLASDEGERLVKVAIAEAVNKVYHSMHDEEEEEEGEGHEEVEPEGEAEDGEEDVEHPEWHSQEGPVLKVYLTNYAWVRS